MTVSEDSPEIDWKDVTAGIGMMFVRWLLIVFIPIAVILVAWVFYQAITEGLMI